MQARATRALGFSGAVAPVLFTVFVIVESLLRPGYSQISNYISDLGVGPHAILQDINFWATGLLIVAFATGLRAGLGAAGRAASVGPALVGIGGGALFLAGVFPDNPFPYPGEVHFILSVVAFVAFLAAIFVTRAAQLLDPKWGRFSSFSGVMGILAVVTFALLLTIATPGQAGLVQRLFVAPVFLWIGGTGAKLYWLSSGVVIPSSAATSLAPSP